MTGKVGVVMPCRNVASYVEDSLASLATPGSPIRSVVCVDDGSTDGTADVIHRASKSLPFDLEVLQSSGVGAGAARNLGLKKIDAEFCQFLDADDLLLPGKLERQLHLAQSLGADIVAGSYVLRSTNGLDRQVDVVDNTWSGLLTSRLGCTSAMLFRVEAVRTVGGWSESLQSSQEYDLVFRMVKAGSSTTSDHENLTVKKERPDAISAGEPAPRLARFVELRSQMIAHLVSIGELTPELEAEGLETMFRAIQRIGETDVNLATSLFDTHVPKWFTPGGASVLSRAYGRAFNVLGFERVEAFRRKIEGIRG